MANKPILFNTEMVQAILEGRKTQTRRIVKGIEGIHPYRAEPAENAYDTLAEWDFLCGEHLNGGYYDFCQAVKAPCAVGDVLWVRETWANIPVSPGGHFRIGGRYYYKADGDQRPTGWRGAWKPSIHMPKKAARIFLKVISIRAERLNDISNAEVLAEGIPHDYPMNPVYCPMCKGTGLVGTHHPDTLGHMDVDCSACAKPTVRFSNLWDSTVTDYLSFGWRSNPWVWVIEFERCKKPEGWCE